MVQAKFDPALALKFDLGRGTVSQSGAGARLVLSADVVAALLKGAPAEVVRDAGQQLGTELGRRVQPSLGEIAETPPERVLEFLGGELALLGLGGLGLERWGQALVFSLVDNPLGAAGDDFMCALFDGALLRIYGKATRVVCVKREGERARYLVCSERAAAQVTSWLGAGVGWGDALTRLQGGGDA